MKRGKNTFQVLNLRIYWTIISEMAVRKNKALKLCTSEKILVYVLLVVATLGNNMIIVIQI